MAELSLTNSDLVCHIDDCYFAEFNRVKWRADKGGYPTCDRKTKLYAKFGTRRLHRIIYQSLNGKISRDTQVDHIDRNVLNNNSCNLRIGTNQQNNINKAKRLDSKAVYKGVTRNKHSSRFTAQITHNGKQIHLGTFDCPVLAALKYNEAVVELFGEWAYTNDIDNVRMINEGLDDETA